uniref:Uncharacterized protein n=1 Tax=Oryza nivara TaxID=4536 RepID=A0A0E0HSI1_ORYNI
MKSSMVLASVILLIMAATAHGLRLDMGLHAALNNEGMLNSKWQSTANRPIDTRRASNDRRGPGRSRTRPPKMSNPHDMDPRFSEDYSGPGGHSPNHHRTTPCDATSINLQKDELDHATVPDGYMSFDSPIKLSGLQETLRLFEGECTVCAANSAP